MEICRRCKKRLAAHQIGLCVYCIRNAADSSELLMPHRSLRRNLGLPEIPPHSPGGLRCTFCANECSMGEGETGYCGLRGNKNGQLKTLAQSGNALAFAYYDTLPTNCCAAWFCEGSCERGDNLAVFFFGCNFDCLYCQNASHKRISTAPSVTLDELVRRALVSRVRCICFFGGSPEPQFPLALGVAEQISGASTGTIHICWEWNGAGNPLLVKRAAILSEETGGVMKFDIKAHDPALHLALTGQENRRVLDNFRLVAETISRKNVLTATTLLVPYYIDAREVEAIAAFIAEIDPDIPYSLLVFHPDFALRDLPITPRSQVEECFLAAKKHLSRVNIGNIYLIS